MPTIRSKEPCPVCGEHEWECYDEDFRGEITINTACMSMPCSKPMIDWPCKQFQSSREQFDLCVNCGTAVN